MLSSDYCFARDPGNQTNVAKARAAGGRGRARVKRAQKLMPAVLKPVLDRLLEALPRIEDGSLDAPGAGHGQRRRGGGPRADGQLEERLAALETAQQARGGWRRVSGILGRLGRPERQQDARSHADHPRSHEQQVDGAVRELADLLLAAIGRESGAGAYPADSEGAHAYLDPALAARGAPPDPNRSLMERLAGLLGTPPRDLAAGWRRR